MERFSQDGIRLVVLRIGGDWRSNGSEIRA